jgi:hypothetical protein
MSAKFATQMLGLDRSSADATGFAAARLMQSISLFL